MKIGDVDGLRVIYDDSGRPILEPGEQIIRHVRDDNISVSEGAGFWTTKSHFAFTAEKGELFVTTNRLVFLRKPDPLLAAKDDAYPIGMADALSKAYRARELRRLGAFEYCVIDHAEVEGFWVKKRDCGIMFLNSPSKVTRKAVIYRRSTSDDKLDVLKGILHPRLPETEPEDRRGSFLLGTRHPLLGKQK